MIQEVDENKESYDEDDSKCSSSTLPSLDSSPNDDDKNIKDIEIQKDSSNIKDFFAEEERVHKDNEREFEKEQGHLNDEDKNNCMSVLLDVDRINIDKIGRDLKEEQGGSNNEVKHDSNDIIDLIDDDGNDEEDHAIIVDSNDEIYHDEEQGCLNIEAQEISNNVVALVVDDKRDDNEYNEKLEQTDSSGNEIINKVDVFLSVGSRDHYLANNAENIIELSNSSSTVTNQLFNASIGILIW